jgi:peptide/nickel transport system substrate-binding protein
VLFGVLLTGCAPEAPKPSDSAAGSYKGPLVIAPEPSGPRARVFNPFVGEPLWGTRHVIYEPMLRFNSATGSYVPWLATEYAWSDRNSRLTFTLRESVVWADGQPLTPDDVVFTFDVLRKNRKLDVNRIWDFLADVKAADSRRVVASFKRVFTPGLAYVGQLRIVPAHRWASVEDPATFADAEPVGTGPFNHVLKVEPRVLELGRNERYWQKGKPAVAQLRVEYYPTNEAALAALAGGQVDWAGIFIKDVEAAFVARDTRNHAYWFPPYGDAAILYVNTVRAPFDDVAVRKAMSRALDRPRIVREALDGHAVPADVTGLTEGQRRWKDPALVAGGVWTSRDVAAAEAALEAAGLKRGPDGIRASARGKLSYDVEVPAEWTDWVAAAQIIASNLKEIGLDARPKLLPVDSWRERLRKGEFAISMGFGDRGPTPYQFYRGLMGRQTLERVGERAAANFGRFADKEASELLERFEAATDPTELKELTHRLEAIFDARAPAIPLFSNPSWGEFNRKRFRGFPDQTNPYAPLPPHDEQQPALVLLELKPV